jgi:hypothetical protein
MDKEQILAHLDPFSNRFNPPKIHDGKASMSSAIKLRMTGQTTLPTTTGGHVTLCLGPGLSSNFYAYNGLPSVAFNEPIYSSHIGTEALRSTIKAIRLVGCAARFSLLNNADQNEGYWEAIRVPTTYTELLCRTDIIGGPGVMNGSLNFYNVIENAGSDLSQHSTYQTGKLKDLHKFQFKLNSTTNEHPFTDLSVIGDGAADGAQTPETLAKVDKISRAFIDETFDCVLIRVYGRNEAALPSMLRYEIVANQEVVFKEQSQVSRLMQRSFAHPDMSNVLAQTNYEMPGVRTNE